MKASTWFARNTQQAVMSRAGVLPVMIRSGTTTKSAQEKPIKVSGEKVFVVGKSLVGGKDRVGGEA